jgi:hypothetical protein
MKVGDIAYVNSTATGDQQWWQKLYRTKKPVLIIDVYPDPDGGCWFLYNGEKYQAPQKRMKVIQ